MRRMLVGSMVFAAFVVLPFTVTAQNGNKNKGKTTQATAPEYAQLARLSQVVGKVVSADATKITVSLDHPHAVQGSGKNGRPTVTVQRDQIEFELPLKEKAVVKKMYIAAGFDEKGMPKTSGSADGKKPASAPGGGYLCDVADLVPGTVVRLQLAPPKKSATPAKKDDDAAASDLSARSIVQSVTALSEPKDQMAADNGNNKKKKNQ